MGTVVKYQFLSAAVSAWLIAVGSPDSSTSHASRTFTPYVNPHVVALAKEWFRRFRTGDIDRSQLDAATSNGLSPEVVRLIEHRLNSYGKPTSYRYVGLEDVSSSIGYGFLWEFKTGAVLEAIALDRNQKIVGFDFKWFVTK